MGAPKGNQFWKKRSKHGVDRIFSDPEVLREECIKYFESVEDSPIQEPIVNQGELSDSTKPLARPFTIIGLSLFLGITQRTWNNYQKVEELEDVIEWAEQVIYEHKFSGATVGIFKASIISRDLGLKDASSTELTGSVNHTQTVEFVGVSSSGD